MGIIQKIHKLTDLPELTDVSRSKILVASNGKNYAISSELIKGKKIANISEIPSKEDGGLNIINILFSDGTSTNIFVYNGSTGNKGLEGFEGPKGDTGNNANADLSAITGAKGVFTVVNDYIISNDHAGHDDYCSKAWSAYRGKIANRTISSINETFVSDSEYELLWNNISYIVAEFTTNEENQETTIFANDTNAHTFFKKYWTYEEGDVATYFVAIYGEVPVYDENNNVIGTEIGVVRYDPVVANLWTDIYMGEGSGYFEASNNQLKDIEPLYVYDAKQDQYVQIYIDTNPNIIDEETGEQTINDNYKDKEFDYYSEKLKTYIHANYTNSTNTWTYDLAVDDEDRFVKPLYTEVLDQTTGESSIIEIENYLDPSLPNYTKIDYSGYTKYYTSYDEESLIENITKYLAISEERCFVKKNGKYEEIEYATLSDENKAKCLKKLEDDFTEYIFVKINPVEYSYAFTYHYNDTYRMKLVRKEVTEVYQKGNITLYSYFENREYFTSEIKEIIDETDADGKVISSHYETIYTKIIIPSWIYAEFTTNEEDENIIVLNSTKELGNEDQYNQYIDITDEDYEDVSDDEIIPIRYLLYVGMKKIYIYSGDNMYDEVDFEDIDITGSTVYYEINGHYEEISADKAIDIQQHEAVYIKLDEDTYTFADAIEASKTYYIWKEVRTVIQDIAEFIKTQNITIFTGIPKQLPIKFVPENASYKIATIEYDSDLITMFENGRICAIGEQPDENNETHTTLTITPKEGNPLVFNITILTPASSIQMGLGENNVDDLKINIGETTTVECVVKPITTSNKRLIFNYGDCIELSEKTEIPEQNKTTALITGIEKGSTTIRAIALDGFGAEQTCEIEIVKPVTSISWDQPFIVPVKYTRTDIQEWRINWMNEHPGETINEDEVPTTNDVKEYRMTILKDVDYELIPKVEPEDCSYPEIEWTTSDNVAVVSTRYRTVIDSPEISYIATQEDVDNDIRVDATGHIDQENGLIVSIGEKIILQDEESHEEKYYVIRGSHITYIIDNIPGYVEDSPESSRIVLTGQLKYIYGDQTERFPINAYVIINQSVETVTVSPSTLSFNIGTTKKLTATLGPEDAIKDFVWITSNPDVVTIDNDGIVSGIAPGTAVITAKATDGSEKYATCDITVTVPMNDINFMNAINGIVYVGKGKEETINVNLIYNSVPNSTNDIKLGVDWNTSNNNIVSISDAGVDGNGNSYCTISGVSLGSATIVAKAKDNSGTIGAIQVIVIEQIENIEFPQELRDITMDVNDSLSLMPEFTPAYSTNQVLTWSSSDNTKATVNSSGIVTAIASTDKNNENEDIPVIITATTTDGSALSAECHIIIN